jgi:thiol:disulfide interchange protein
MNGHLVFTLFRNRTVATREQVRRAQEQSMEDGWLSSLPAALEQADRNNQRILIDFWATWCKSCLKMNKTTFKDPAVQDALEPFVKIKCQAEDLNDPEVKEVLDHFEVIGLPTYVVLSPMINDDNQ